MENGLNGLNLQTDMSYIKCESCINCETCEKCIDKDKKNDEISEGYYIIINIVNGIPIKTSIKASSMSMSEALKKSYIEAAEWMDDCFKEAILNGEYLESIVTT